MKGKLNKQLLLKKCFIILFSILYCVIKTIKLSIHLFIDCFPYIMILYVIIYEIVFINTWCHFLCFNVYAMFAKSNEFICSNYLFLAQ